MILIRLLVMAARKVWILGRFGISGPNSIAARGRFLIKSKALQLVQSRMGAAKQARIGGLEKEPSTGVRGDRLPKLMQNPRRCGGVVAWHFPSRVTGSPAKQIT